MPSENAQEAYYCNGSTVMANETVLLETEKNEILENFKKTNPLIFNHIKECYAYFGNVLPVTVAVSIKEDGTDGQ
ncbi:MAG: hypothetical protein LBS75_05020 [Synergistaceae bacterium]|nr:hypothetical protein [Synergistaceae bacterium]